MTVIANNTQNNLIRLRAKLQRTTNNPGKDLPKMIMFCDWLSETNQEQK